MKHPIRALLAVLVVTLGASAGPAQAAPERRCAPPAADAPFGRATPEQVGLDPDAVGRAVALATIRMRLSFHLYRHGCLVAGSPLNPVTERVPWSMFSATKSVVSLLAGIAIGDGKLHLDDPIGRHLPAGWGDEAHRAITVRQLLTETAGLRQSIFSEFATVLAEPDVAREALSLPLVHRPGTRFEYTQRVPDLLAFVVQRAVGEDLQEFAQRRLLGPIGIARDDYVWLRDRGGKTYGYAWLFLQPRQMGRIGQLLLARGAWRGHQVVPADYLEAATTPTPTNPCYGFLFWTNAGRPCKTASVPSQRTLPRRMIPAAPPDLFAMVGALQQNVFVVPSLDLVVTWTGLGGDIQPDPQSLLSASPGADLYQDLFRLLTPAVRGADVHPDDLEIVHDGPNLNVDPSQFVDLSVLLAGLGLAPGSDPGCNVLACTGIAEGSGPLRNVEALLRSLQRALR